MVLSWRFFRFLHAGTPAPEGRGWQQRRNGWQEQWHYLYETVNAVMLPTPLGAKRSWEGSGSHFSPFLTSLNLLPVQQVPAIAYHSSCGAMLWTKSPWGGIPKSYKAEKPPKLALAASRVPLQRKQSIYNLCLISHTRTVAFVWVNLKSAFVLLWEPG